MSAMQRMVATGGILVGLVGVTLLMLAAAVPAQPAPDWHREIARVERRVEHLESRITAYEQEAVRVRVDSASRLSAAEREIEINRIALWGLGGGIIAQLVLGGLTLWRLNGRQ